MLKKKCRRFLDFELHSAAAADEILLFLKFFGIPINEEAPPPTYHTQPAAA